MLQGRITFLLIMFTKLRQHWVFLVVMSFLTVFYLRGVHTVPFHPDESTQLFMSADFEKLITNPTGMAWTQGQTETQISRYRFLDAPLTRYLIGAGRLVAGLPALPVDWDWSTSWEQNSDSGALPSNELLLAGRFAVASFYPLTLILLYFIGLQLNGRLLGLTIVIVFGANALILLHTRRAMAESALVFGFVLTLYMLYRTGKYPFLTGLAVGLAFCAKQSAIALLPAALLAAFWVPGKKLSRRAAGAGLCLSGFLLLTLILNPFLWKQPVTALIKAINERHNLLEQQVSDVELYAPGQVLRTSSERVAVLLAQVFIAPPMFSEVGNYRTQAADAEANYLRNPGNQLWRTPIFAGLNLGFFLLGILAVVRTSMQTDFRRRKSLLLTLFALTTVFIGLALTVPLPWQRYSLPLIPIVSIFTGFGITWVIENSRRLIFNGSTQNLLAQILSQFTSDSRVS